MPISLRYFLQVSMASKYHRTPGVVMKIGVWYAPYFDTWIAFDVGKDNFIMFVICWSSLLTLKPDYRLASITI